jgi:hypothetical protein
MAEATIQGGAYLVGGSYVDANGEPLNAEQVKQVKKEAAQRVKDAELAEEQTRLASAGITLLEPSLKRKGKAADVEPEEEDDDTSDEQQKPVNLSRMNKKALLAHVRSAGFADTELDAKTNAEIIAAFEAWREQRAGNTPSI